jgi:hypothetical protein
VKVNPKIKAVGAAGSATVVVVYIASLFGLEVPTEAAQAFTVLIGLVAGYFKTA